MTSNAAAILQITFAAKLARFVSSGIEKLHISVPLQNYRNFCDNFFGVHIRGLKAKFQLSPAFEKNDATSSSIPNKCDTSYVNIINFICLLLNYELEQF